MTKVKKLFLVTCLFLICFILVGCIERVDCGEDPDLDSTVGDNCLEEVTKDLTEEYNYDETLLDSKDVISIDLYRNGKSLLNNNGWECKNKDFINYALGIIKSCSFTKKVDSVNGKVMIDLCRSDNYYFNIIFTEDNKAYLEYSIGGYWAEPKTTYYIYEATGKKDYKNLNDFIQHDNDWFAEEVLIKKLDCELSEYYQEAFVKEYILESCALSDYYSLGMKFSGYVKGYYGKYGEIENRYYAVMIEAGLTSPCVEVDETIDDLTFRYSDPAHKIVIAKVYVYGYGGVSIGATLYSLKDAYEKGIIKHDDLLAIYNEYNKN